MNYSALTNKGKKRDNNEDYILSPESYEIGISKDDVSHYGHLYILCDGVGGHNAGEVASSFSANSLMGKWYSPYEENIPYSSRLQNLIDEVNTEIITMAKQNPLYDKMATTLSALLIKGNSVFVANIGDSRAYLYRAGLLKQISEDHSYVQELYKNGQIPKRELRRHPLGGLITKAIGIKIKAEADVFELLSMEGDLFLLCSDGLTDMMADRTIKKILSQPMSLEEKANALIQKALDKGGLDNVSVLMVIV